MVFETLSFLAAEVNGYFNQKLGTTTAARLKVGNVALALDGKGLGSGDSGDLTNKAILSLVNLEEDRASGTPTNRVKVADVAKYKNPPVLLNFYALFAINRTDYVECLKWLGHIITFFQHQRTFTPITHPTLASSIQQLSVELYTMNFEQVNHLWSTLGGKYLPSALYKVRQVSIDENVIRDEGGLIKEVGLSGRHIQPRGKVRR